MRFFELDRSNPELVPFLRCKLCGMLPAPPGGKKPVFHTWVSGFRSFRNVRPTCGFLHSIGLILHLCPFSGANFVGCFQRRPGAKNRFFKHCARCRQNAWWRYPERLRFHARTAGCSALLVRFLPNVKKVHYSPLAPARSDVWQRTEFLERLLSQNR